jgi:3-oxoacyl-[acyl-carrier protein] reductase
MLQIEGSVAVITGGASGIGESMAKHWVRNKGKVVVMQRDSKPGTLARLEEEIREMGGEVATMKGDATSEEDNARLAQLAIDTFGAINLVLPCAALTKDAFFLSPDRETGKVRKKMGLDDFRKVLEVNVLGVFLTIRECAEQMINHGCTGLICLMSSTSCTGKAGQLNYSASKAAMAVMPKVITAEFFRKDIAHRIRCIAVAPGYTDTPLIRSMPQQILEANLANVPMQRLLKPEEVASFIAGLYQNEMADGELYYLHGGLRLGAKA